MPLDSAPSDSSDDSGQVLALPPNRLGGTADGDFGGISCCTFRTGLRSSSENPPGYSLLPHLYQDAANIAPRHTRGQIKLHEGRTKKALIIRRAIPCSVLRPEVYSTQVGSSEIIVKQCRGGAMSGRNTVLWVSLVAVAIFAALAVTKAQTGGNSDGVAAVTKLENDTVKADLANDKTFYKKVLADDWTGEASTKPSPVRGSCRDRPFSGGQLFVLSGSN